MRPKFSRESKKGDNPGIKVGKWVNTDQRFVAEYTPEGFFHLTLGGGSSSAEDSLEDSLPHYQNFLDDWEGEDYIEIGLFTPGEGTRQIRIDQGMMKAS